jgi:hypothetical protein
MLPDQRRQPIGGGDVSRALGPKDELGSLETLWLALIIGLLYAGYFVLRYGGIWTENDTAFFSQVTALMLRAGNVGFAHQYTHGFGYPAWLGSLSLLTGISVPVLNTVVMPYVGAVFLIMAAFLAYRTLLGATGAGFLATSLLLATSDVFFSVLRGNHEKLDIAFMLVAIYALFKGFEAMGRGSAMDLLIWVVLFYTLIFGNASVNDYFASTFVFAATLTLPCGYVLLRYHRDPEAQRPAMVRFTITVAVSWLLVWWVMLYVFPAAGSDFRLVHTAGEKLRDLFLSLQVSSNPYVAPGQQWAGPAVSIVLGAFRWLLFGGSFIVWITQLLRVFVRRTRFTLAQLFLLALYGAFGLVVAISIPVDFVGLQAGTNLELRNFTYFALVAAPLLAWGLREIDPASSAAITWVARHVRGAQPAPYERGDDGCPFWAMAIKSQSHLCLSPKHDLSALSPMYIDAYCSRVQHVHCKFFIHAAGDEARARPQFERVQTGGVKASAAEPRKPVPVPKRRRIYSGAAGAVLVAFIVLGLLKSTVDPLVSNQWIFYTPAERQALDFFWHHRGGMTMWTGPDNRIVSVATTWHLDQTGDEQVIGYAMRPEVRDLLWSPQIAANAAEVRIVLLAIQQQDRVYDNGGSQIFRETPRTPFQN